VRKHCFASSSAITLSASAAAFIETKITDRYCVPTSFPLPVQSCRIVRGQENLQQLAIGNRRRSKFTLTTLHVSGSRADLSVAGLFALAAHVTALHLLHAFQLLQHGLHAPEAPSAYNPVSNSAILISMLVRANDALRNTPTSCSLLEINEYTIKYSSVRL